MDESSFFALSPVDGRYRKQTDVLAAYFSEAALIRHRILVEVEYFIALCQLGLPQLRDFDKKMYSSLRSIAENITSDDLKRIKDIESVTNHDVKAVEYFLREKFESLQLSDFREFIHFGLTSQDVNNTAQPVALKMAHQHVLMPMLDELIAKISALAKEWKDVPMLAFTHGQPASPTMVGKEFLVFVERFQLQVSALRNTTFYGKFGGATGNLNAHYAAYPDIDWHAFADDFLNESLGLVRYKITTQVEHYDMLAAYFDNLKRINTILTDFCRDVWLYISMDYFNQKIVKSEVGSSAMPHKVNPIDFENAEGNLGVSNALLEFMAAKLPVSRLQRDLTDSTVLRNTGVALAHMLIAVRSVQKGLNKLVLNRQAVYKDLDNNWMIIAEGIQTILRREGYPDPYGVLKDLTRSDRLITREVLQDFINQLEISNRVKAELLQLSPFTYTGRIGSSE